MKRHKHYAKVRCRKTGKLLLLYRKVAAEMLGRPLFPGEIVHHRNGDHRDNAPEKLIVLPNQGYHAHVEYHLRCGKWGMPSPDVRRSNVTARERPQQGYRAAPVPQPVVSSHPWRTRSA